MLTCQPFKVLHLWRILSYLSSFLLHFSCSCGACSVCCVLCCVVFCVVVLCCVVLWCVAVCCCVLCVCGCVSCVVLGEEWVRDVCRIKTSLCVRSKRPRAYQDKEGDRERVRERRRQRKRERREDREREREEKIKRSRENQNEREEERREIRCVVCGCVVLTFPVFLFFKNNQTLE